jgi:hypothetical protein
MGYCPEHEPDWTVDKVVEQPYGTEGWQQAVEATLEDLELRIMLLEETDRKRVIRRIQNLCLRLWYGNATTAGRGEKVAEIAMRRRPGIFQVRRLINWYLKRGFDYENDNKKSL